MTTITREHLEDEVLKVDSEESGIDYAERCQGYPFWVKG